MRYNQIGQQVRADGPQRHLVKQGTPTMGGVILIIAMLITVFLLVRTSSSIERTRVFLMIFATVSCGAVGFIDDTKKLAKERSLGLRPNAKMISLTLVSVFFTLLAVNFGDIAPIVTIPLVRSFNLGVLTSTISVAGATFQIPWLYMVFVFLLMVGMANSVNLTDGLDGLVGGTIMIAMVVMAIIAYRTDQLSTAVMAASACGACVGFLWFNSYPATIFMGDTGSLAFGGVFAAIAIITKSEVVSLLVGGIFVIEALSVIIQVTYFKLTRRRVFLMAPLHHHFEQKGWTETKLVVRFWIITALSAAVGFAWFFSQSA